LGLSDGQGVRIGITDNFRPKPAFENYEKWVLRVRKDVGMVKLSYHLRNAALVKELDGLILTGGGDVHPGLYGKSDQIARTEEVNEMRDRFEFEVIEQALEADLPILGVCRGMQIMNVYLGGSLEIDLPSAGFRSHVIRDGIDHRHQLIPRPDTMLETICGAGPHRVNSVHHQAVERPGKGLMVAATSDDGVIEAMEWVLKDHMPFLLLVQWHPERLTDFDNPCSARIAEQFLKEVSLYTSQHHHIQPDKETEHSNHG
jgi:putative glutamine amidotransferase